MALLSTPEELKERIAELTALLASLGPDDLVCLECQSRYTREQKAVVRICYCDHDD